MVSLARKILASASTGLVLGVLMYFIGLAVSAAVPNTSILPAVGFIVGFGSPMAVMFSEDVAIDQHNGDKPHVDPA